MTATFVSYVPPRPSEPTPTASAPALPTSTISTPSSSFDGLDGEENATEEAVDSRLESDREAFATSSSAESLEEAEDSVDQAVDNRCEPAQEAVSTSSSVNGLDEEEDPVDNAVDGYGEPTQEASTTASSFQLPTTFGANFDFGVGVSLPGESAEPKFFDCFAIEAFPHEESGVPSGTSLSKMKKDTSLNKFGRKVFAKTTFNEPVFAAALGEIALTAAPSASSTSVRLEGTPKPTPGTVTSHGSSSTPTAPSELYNIQDLDTSVFRLLLLGQPVNMFSSRLATCGRLELVRLHLQSALPAQVSRPTIAPTDPCTPIIDPLELDSQPTTERARMVYRVPPPVVAFLKVMNRAVGTSSTECRRSSSWSGRYFLVCRNGESVCADEDHRLYGNIPVIEDDGARDFESIASPTKHDLGEPRDDDGFCLPDAADSTEDGHSLSPYNLAKHVSHANMTSWAWGVSEVTDYEDDFADDAKSTCTVVHHDITRTYLGVRDTTIEDTVDRSGDTIMIEKDAEQRGDVRTPAGYEWACELKYTLLGTELLYTFLEVLNGTDNMTATKQAVVAAFLELVNLARAKRGEILLPSSITAASVLSSEIVSHIIFLGMTTLATFLKRLYFGVTGEVTIVDLYIAWDAISKLEAYARRTATTGIMGALGRALGRIP